MLKQKLLLHLVVMQLHALALQPSGTDGAEAETAGQELQPDGGEQGRGLEGGAQPVRGPGLLAALLLHAGDQHHDLMQRLQPQLQRPHTTRLFIPTPPLL